MLLSTQPRGQCRRPAGWSAALLHVASAGWSAASRLLPPCSWMASRQASWPGGRLAGQLAGCAAGLPAGWLAGWPGGRSVGRLAARLRTSSFRRCDHESLLQVSLHIAPTRVG